MCSDREKRQNFVLYLDVNLGHSRTSMNRSFLLCMVEHTCNPSSWEVEAKKKKNREFRGWTTCSLWMLTIMVLNHEGAEEMSQLL